MIRLMEDPNRASHLAAVSLQAMQQYKWTDVAAQYVDFLESVLTPVSHQARQVFTKAA
jgi:hypothetical protein